MKYFIYRNSTVETLFGNASISYSGYDDISVVDPDADVYIWFYMVPFKLEEDLLIEEIISYKKKIQLVYNKIPANKSLLIFSLERLFSLNFVEENNSLKEIIQDHNREMISFAQQHLNTKFIDFSEFLHHYPMQELVDWKYYFISQIQLSPKLTKPFRKWFNKKMDSIQLKRKKCLILDLDNTLWGGILGEDGIEGIKIGGEYPGSAFLFFQMGLVELSKKGVILAICSKNNETDVLEVWDKNPYIYLKQEYISAHAINWNNKADNIRKLSEELNIGLDSLVFIDDNPVERELVRQQLPEVEVPEFPVNPYELPAFFKYLVENYFTIYTLTEEDLRKTKQYKENSERKRMQDTCTDLEEFLASLNIEIEIKKADSFNLERIAQMTQKTNQFNLTTYRYSNVDIINFLDRKDRVYCINVKDKFGDNGITGCCILQNKEEKYLSINTFLLSCRVLGKGIELVFLHSLLKKLKEEGIRQVNATYIPTNKNMQVCQFYEKAGFQLDSTDNNGCKSYSLDLDTYELKINPIYKVTFLQ